MIELIYDLSDVLCYPVFAVKKWTNLGSNHDFWQISTNNSFALNAVHVQVATNARTQETRNIYSTGPKTWLERGVFITLWPPKNKKRKTIISQTFIFWRIAMFTSGPGTSVVTNNENHNNNGNNNNQKGQRGNHTPGRLGPNNTLYVA